MKLGLRAATSFERRLGYRFRDVDLLEVALTHRSFANERGVGEHYERLEFLGDAVLGMVAAEWLYVTYPELSEGELSRHKALMVSAAALARYAQSVGLGEALRLGVGEERSGGRSKPSLLADSLEAVLGAVYLDGGLRVAKQVIEPLLVAGIAESVATPHADAKTALQEAAQARGWPLPEYRLVAESGPDHQKVFTVECWLHGEARGVAQGETKKLAEQRAALAAYARLESEEPAGR